MFLTTNRVGQFDEAFMSRIHVAIGYEPLDDSAREQIWETLFAKLKSDRKFDCKIDSAAKRFVQGHQDVKRLKWNGREIRNGAHPSFSAET